MTILEQNLQTILDEKTIKIIPENIKKGVTIFGVTGTLEPNASIVEGVKLFKTKEEMNSSTGNAEGDLAVVYGTSYVGTYRLNNGAWTQIGNSTEE